MYENMKPADEIRREVIDAMASGRVSARQIMRDTGISHVTVNTFLKGERDTQPQTIVKLCRYLALDWHSEVSQ